MTVEYREWVPVPALSGHIEAIWSLSGGAIPGAGPQRILPDGCSELILNFGDPVEQVRGTDRLFESLGAESMDFAEILFRLERMFDVALPLPDVVAAARAWALDAGAPHPLAGSAGDCSSEDVLHHFTSETFVRLVAWQLVQSGDQDHRGL